MDTPILNRLKEYNKEDTISFHFPGHKGRRALVDWGGLIPKIDVTELEGMDNLLDPRGIIKESQENLRGVYKTYESLYGVNGSTSLIYTALNAISRPGDKIIVQRNCHVALYNALILNDLEPIYIYPKYDGKRGLSLGIDLDQLENLLVENQDAIGVFITYPDYYGICQRIGNIADLLRRHKRLLIVDEAHGGHLIFSDKLPKSALEYGADIVIHSSHKTLPSFTQTGLLHINSPRVDLDRLRRAFNLFTTTSPSYLFMASNEASVAYMDGLGRKALDNNISMVKSLMERLEGLEGLYILEEDMGDDSLGPRDISRFLFKIEGYRGSDLVRLFRDSYGINLEMSYLDYALAVVGAMNTEGDLMALEAGILDLLGKGEYKGEKGVNISIASPGRGLGLRQAYYREGEEVDLKDAVGRISKSFIIPYPPGIPLLVAGEEISREACEYIGYLREKNIEIVGLIGYNKGQVLVLK